MSKEDVEIWVNTQNPTGIKTKWKISDEKFNSGEESGFINICDGKETRHWLLDC